MKTSTIPAQTRAATPAAARAVDAARMKEIVYETMSPEQIVAFERDLEVISGVLKS